MATLPFTDHSGSYLITTVESALHLPEHTHDFLERMRSLPPNNLKSLTFFTVEVEALFTNISVQTVIKDAWNNLPRCDLQELLDSTLGESYFVDNKQVYLLALVLHMATNPAPKLATVELRKLESGVIYVDLRITLPTNCRSYDDLNGAKCNCCKFLHQKVNHRRLPISLSILFRFQTPGRRLKDILTDSRPLDNAKCTTITVTHTPTR